MYTLIDLSCGLQYGSECLHNNGQNRAWNILLSDLDLQAAQWMYV